MCVSITDCLIKEHGRIKFDVNFSMFTFHLKLIHTYSVATSNISLGFYKIQGVRAVFRKFVM